MPKPTKGPRLGGSAAHERMMLANLATSLFEHGAITTTETRAKRVQPLAEKLITKARRGDLAARRLVLKTVRSRAIVAKLFEEIAPAIDKDREGGCTRIIKLPNRLGDNAPMAELSLVTEKVEKKKKAKPAAKTAKPAAKKDEKAEQEAPAKDEETKADDTAAQTESAEDKSEKEETK